MKIWIGAVVILATLTGRAEASDALTDQCRQLKKVKSSDKGFELTKERCEKSNPACQHLKQMKPSDDGYDWWDIRCKGFSVDVCRGIVRRIDTTDPALGWPWEIIAGDNGCSIRGIEPMRAILKVCPVGTRCDVIGWSGGVTAGMQEVWSARRLK